MTPERKAEIHRSEGYYGSTVEELLAYIGTLERRLKESNAGWIAANAAYINKAEECDTLERQAAAEYRRGVEDAAKLASLYKMKETPLGDFYDSTALDIAAAIRALLTKDTDNA